MFTQNPRLHKIQDNLFRVKTALDHASDAIQIVNELGKSLYHNKVFIHLFGYTVEQLNEAGGIFAVFAEPDIPQQILSSLEEKNSWNGSVKIYSLSGELKLLYLRIYKVMDNHSTSVGNICMFNEKNSQLYVYSDREKYLKKIEDAEKLARLGYFSSAISHELNNPLNIIQTKLFLLKRGLSEIHMDESHETWEHIDKINQQIIRLSNLAQSILQYAKPALKKDYLVNINQLLLRTLGYFEDFFSETIHLQKKFDPNLSMIPGDETGLEIVFKNIILNAIESIHSKGMIEITTKNFDDKHIHVIIKDTGIGITQENINKVFDPFYTNKEKAGGYGLGLSLCENIIEEHNGFISIKSKENIGTIFVIHLPRV
ncbi:GHKL domain-containing protein [candidate division KSB1 bacterium]|nr:GHKL domain-containing protein [candidate division KSB1 bacterium]